MEGEIPGVIIVKQRESIRSESPAAPSAPRVAVKRDQGLLCNLLKNYHSPLGPFLLFLFALTAELRKANRLMRIINWSDLKILHQWLIE